MGLLKSHTDFETGGFVQRGRHAELLATGGLYRRMWDFQNQVLVG